jgi:SH3 domain protein
MIEMHTNIFSLKKVILISMLLLPAGMAIAEEIFYVNDHLVITLRAGKGGEYRILRTLPSGAELRVIEADGEYVRVSTTDGTEGWVGKQYLRDTPTARIQLKEVSKKLERYEQENDSLKESVNQLKNENKALKSSNQSLEKDNSRFEKENSKIMEIASRPLELESKNKKLSTESVKINAEIKQLSSENRELKDSAVQKWFMAGSGVLFLGIILGLILPKLRGRRTSGWSEL